MSETQHFWIAVAAVVWWLLTFAAFTRGAFALDWDGTTWMVIAACFAVAAISFTIVAVFGLNR